MFAHDATIRYANSHCYALPMCFMPLREENKNSTYGAAFIFSRSWSG